MSYETKITGAQVTRPERGAIRRKRVAQKISEALSSAPMTYKAKRKKLYPSSDYPNWDGSAAGRYQKN